MLLCSQSANLWNYNDFHSNQLISAQYLEFFLVSGKGKRPASKGEHLRKASICIYGKEKIKTYLIIKLLLLGFSSLFSCD